eukprot:NODE_1526_length_1917_cov_42.138796_g1294_i0.p1 GENE.NODE_1526_length_1917_cov_42.138796_g1294_i0~~NODE_1526_length_1917_cov_42.138796_g1294_i0.p1  ORF type:complete len:210 (-),score=25.63 NODE_1526_length_1917_cov_42.138796_g1294_i0:1195-1824(-)
MSNLRTKKGRPFSLPDSLPVIPTNISVEVCQANRILNTNDNLFFEIIPQFLWISGADFAHDFSLLREMDVRHVINTARECPDRSKEAEQEGLRYMKLDVAEFPDNDVTPMLMKAVKYIDDAKLLGGRVLLHCRKGISRSAALAVVYLVLRAGFNWSDAYTLVKEKRGGVIDPCFAFRMALENHPDISKEFIHKDANSPLEIPGRIVAVS